MIDAKTRTQIFRFLVVGITAAVVDFSTAESMLRFVLDASRDLPLDRYSLAKGSGFILGTTVSYLLNKRWTFESGAHDPRQTRNFIILYGATFVANVMVYTILVHLFLGAGLPERASTGIGFLFATAVSTVMNFVGSKLWVFRHRPSAEPTA